jgi:hypothetical protein
VSSDTTGWASAVDHDLRKGRLMAEAMNQFKATADAHMRRDFEGGKQWVCECEACRSIRSLVGVEKMLHVRPLVREIEETERRLKDLLDGSPSAEKRRLQEHYMKLYDRLADKMAE